MPRLDRLDPDRLAQATAAGLTLLRVWAGGRFPDGFALEGLRALRGWAERFGCALLLVFDFGPGLPRGVPTDRPGGAREPASPRARVADMLDLLTARCRTLLTVLEDTPALLGWELTGIEGLADLPSAQSTRLVRRAAERVRAEDRRHGRDRVVGVGVPRPFPPPWVMAADELDFIALPPSPATAYDPTDRIEGAVQVGAAIRFALSPGGFQPVLHAESRSPEVLAAAAVPRPEEFHHQLLHNLRWAHLASGGAGSGVYLPARSQPMLPAGGWAWRRPDWLPTPAELEDMKAITRFWALAPGRGPVRNVAGSVSVDEPEVLAFASATAERTIGWLLRDSRAADLAVDLRRALDDGPTRPANLDVRLHALDAWLAALARRSLHPLDRRCRESIAVLLHRGLAGMRRACALIDERLAGLADATRQLRLPLLEATPARGSTTVRIRDLPDTSVRLRWVDETTGAVIGESRGRGPQLHVRTPAFTRRLAFVADYRGSTLT